MWFQSIVTVDKVAEELARIESSCRSESAGAVSQVVLTYLSGERVLIVVRLTR